MSGKLKIIMGDPATGLQMYENYGKLTKIIL